MASENVRETRLRRLRARYRKRTTITAIVALLVGLVLGFAGCIVSLYQVDFVSQLFRLGPISPVDVNAPNGLIPTPTPMVEVTTHTPTEEPEAEATQTVQAPDITSTPEVTEPAETSDSGLIITALTVEPTAEVTATPTATPTVEVTATPTATPTVEVTATPTATPTVEVTATPTAEPTAEVTATPTAEPTLDVTVEPTVEPPLDVPTEPTVELPLDVTNAPVGSPAPETTLVPIIVPYGQPYTLQTEITAEGKAREVADDAPYEQLSMTVKVDAHRDPAYYQQHYSTKYKLKGNEAVVQFEMTINDYTGTRTLMPQDFITVSLIGKMPNTVNYGYQLMNAEIGGETNVVVTPGIATTLYKRYAYSPEQGDMIYMAITTWRGGERQEVWFDLVAPEPEPTELQDVLTIGSNGEEVERLQNALIEKGALSGTADGKFGSMTADAVRTMQKSFGMAQTGIADAAFLAKLYAEE